MVAFISLCMTGPASPKGTGVLFFSKYLRIRYHCAFLNGKLLMFFACMMSHFGELHEPRTICSEGL